MPKKENTQLKQSLKIVIFSQNFDITSQSEIKFTLKKL